MYLLYILKKVTLVQNISWIDTVWLNLYPNQMATSGGGGQTTSTLFFSTRLKGQSTLKVKKKRFFYSSTKYTNRCIFPKRYEWEKKPLATHTHTDPWPWHMVLVQSLWREKGDEPLPAGFYIFFKAWQQQQQQHSPVGRERGGFAVLPPHVALPLLNQLPTVLILKKKKKNRATGCRPLWPVPFWILSTTNHQKGSTKREEKKKKLLSPGYVLVRYFFVVCVCVCVPNGVTESMQPAAGRFKVPRPRSLVA